MTLAINGGQPIRKLPFAPWPFFEEDDLASAHDVLASGKVNYWTGEQGRLFEKEFAEYCGRKYAVALANGTLALEAALYALGIGTGDEVIVPCRTFIATASCVALCGAVPVVADVDLQTQNISVQGLQTALSKRTKAVIAVHLAGLPCDLEMLKEFTERNRLFLIEDCAQAHGARYRGRPVGSFGQVAAFSFCQDKIMTTGGEGGMFLTDDEDLWLRVWSRKDHGKDYAIINNSQSVGVRRAHTVFGSNWRLTEVQSALGRSVLKKLPVWVKRRRELAARLTSSFENIPVFKLNQPAEQFFHSYYRYGVVLDPELICAGWSRDLIAQAIRAEGVPCINWNSSEIHREGAFRCPPFAERNDIDSCPNARKLNDLALAFLVHPTITDSDIEDVTAAVEKVMKVAAKQ